MLSVVAQYNLMSWFNLGPSFDQGVRHFHPLAGYQVGAFPTTQFETTIMPQGKWNRRALYLFAGQLGRRALIATGHVYILRSSLGSQRCQGQKAESQNPTFVNQVSHCISRQMARC